MKYIHLDDSFLFTKTPVPGFRSFLRYGDRKWATAFIECSGFGTSFSGLVDGEFCIATSQSEDGGTKIIPGVDSTQRAFVLVGCNKGHRGEVSLDLERTTARILETCMAENKVDGRIEVACVMDIGTQLVFCSKSDGKLQILHDQELYANIVKEVTYTEQGVSIQYFNMDEYYTVDTGCLVYV